MTMKASKRRLEVQHRRKQFQERMAQWRGKPGAKYARSKIREGGQKPIDG